MKKDFTNIAKERPQSLKVLKQAYLDYLIEADKRKWLINYFLFVYLWIKILMLIMYHSRLKNVLILVSSVINIRRVLVLHFYLSHDT